MKELKKILFKESANALEVRLNAANPEFIILDKVNSIDFVCLEIIYLGRRMSLELTEVFVRNVLGLNNHEFIESAMEEFLTDYFMIEADLIQVKTCPRNSLKPSKRIKFIKKIRGDEYQFNLQLSELAYRDLQNYLLIPKIRTTKIKTNLAKLEINFPLTALSRIAPGQLFEVPTNLIIKLNESNIINKNLNINFYEQQKYKF